MHREFMRWIMMGVLIAWHIAVAQVLVLEGKIKDANTHREISGVNISIEELNLNTFSNATGHFFLRVVKPEPEMLVTFQHVAYDTLQMTIEDVLSRSVVYLQERIIPVPPVEVESIEEQLEANKDIPQTVSVIDARVFDLRGFIDAGDLLRTDHSIQIDEDISGKKAVSIRGGEPDEVIVLYNGIKMNSPLDNIFDISLIDLTDVSRFEVIKGSNTALYGPEAFSGVINVVPKAQQDYNARFQFRAGSHKTTGLGVNLYRDFGHLHSAYSFKRNGWERAYPDEPEGQRILENDSEHHTASLAYNFSETPSGRPLTSLGVLFVRSRVDYGNQRDGENLSNINNMITGRFGGNLAGIRDVSISAAYQWLDESQVLRFFNSPADSGQLQRAITDNSWHLNAEKAIHLGFINLLVGYQFQNFELSFKDTRSSYNSLPVGVESAELSRRHHGFVGIGKFSSPARTGFFKKINLNLSFRYDRVEDRQSDETPADNPSRATVVGTIPKNTWNETTFKFSTHFIDNNGITAYNTFINVGSNVKFPTLLQQISTRNVLATQITEPSLLPETNYSAELGIKITKSVKTAPGLYGWEFSGNVFYNKYKNKVRSYFLPGTPIPVFDDVKNAWINGVEGKQTLYFFHKKMTLEFGASRYYFSNPATFPLRSDRKYTLNVMLDQGGYSLQLFAYREGEQVAQIRNNSGGFLQLPVPANDNINLYFSKTFDVQQYKLIFTASVRNLLDDPFRLEGLPIRDRRFYVTLGVQH